MYQCPKTDVERPRKKVQRHSPHRLLRRPVELPGGIAYLGGAANQGLPIVVLA